MIVLYHSDDKIVSVWNFDADQEVLVQSRSISKAFFEMASQFPDTLIVWCDHSQKDNLNLKTIPEIFHHQNIMASYQPNSVNYLPDAIGYVEESPFIKVKKNVSYPTWQMSGFVGGISAEVLNIIGFQNEDNFDYLLNSIAKRGMVSGLFCYSEPSLLLQTDKKNRFQQEGSIYTLFKFVKQHFRTRWVFLLFLNLLVHERKFPLVPLFFSLFHKTLNRNAIGLNQLSIQSSKKIEIDSSIDVIIPTIGRKPYLYDVLCDLRNQTILPTKVIVVEQNPLPESVSELDYLSNEKWPFTIDHVFTHQTGACNARNVALKKAESEWVFLADDDIRFENNFLQLALESLEKLAVNAGTFNCYREGDRKISNEIFQWQTFGSGCSIVNRKVLKNKEFSMKYEFGFGEDADFGMQLRNSGTDIFYFSQPRMLHLKAPIGGFRTKIEFPWKDELFQPKPSPTVMLYKLEHLTKEQLLGYKTILFLKFYKLQKIKNPIQYYKNFQKSWKVSLHWANQLKKQ